MTDSNLAWAHIAGQASESEASADIPPEVDDHAVTALLLKIVNSVIQCISQMPSQRRPESTRS